MWKDDKLKAQLAIVDKIKEYVVISGGLAWHIMSPDHKENKFLHDHKDVDLFVVPEHFQMAMSILKSNGYNRYWTKYDGKTPNFMRYGKSEIRLTDIDKEIEDQRHVKVLLDLFIEKCPFIEVNGFRLVEPKHLLSLYEHSHSSKFCVAVQEATILVARGINPIGREELLNLKAHYPNEEFYENTP
ncbi:MAG: hypothetical protein KAS32_13565 [Candidatus Peribacteraceae bacterium]|nr:hypothetical protein [Candidatus Peribacteraceae bacterium]